MFEKLRRLKIQSWYKAWNYFKSLVYHFEMFSIFKNQKWLALLHGAPVRALDTLTHFPIYPGTIAPFFGLIPTNQSVILEFISEP